MMVRASNSKVLEEVRESRVLQTLKVHGLRFAVRGLGSSVCRSLRGRKDQPQATAHRRFGKVDSRHRFRSNAQLHNCTWSNRERGGRKGESERKTRCSSSIPTMAPGLGWLSRT